MQQGRGAEGGCGPCPAASVQLPLAGAAAVLLAAVELHAAPVEGLCAASAERLRAVAAVRIRAAPAAGLQTVAALMVRLAGGGIHAVAAAAA